MTTVKNEVSFTVGRLLCPSVRHQLKRAEAHGVTWFETKGWLQSHFSVTGPQNIIVRLIDFFESLE